MRWVAPMPPAMWFVAGVVLFAAGFTALWGNPAAGVLLASVGLAMVVHGARRLRAGDRKR